MCVQAGVNTHECVSTSLASYPRSHAHHSTCAKPSHTFAHLNIARHDLYVVRLVVRHNILDAHIRELHAADHAWILWQSHVMTHSVHAYVVGSARRV